VARKCGKLTCGLKSVAKLRQVQCLKKSKEHRERKWVRTEDHQRVQTHEAERDHNLGIVTDEDMNEGG
jgi:hypothetical protein